MKYRSRICLLMWLLLVTHSQTLHAAASKTFQLVAGQQKILAAPGVTRIAIAQPSVADVRVINANEVLVTALNSGRTELTIWRGNSATQYHVLVTRLDPRELRREVERLLGDMEGVRVRSSNGRVYIEGKVLTLSDLERIQEVARLFPTVQPIAKLDPTAHEHIAEALNKQLTHAGLSGARATVIGSTIFLEGMVDSEADLKKAEIITKGVSDNIQTVLRIGASKMIELDVEFVEVAKNSLDRVGIRWPTDISGNTLVDYARTFVFRGSDTETLTVTAGSQGTSLGAALQFNDGITRLLARPRLLTASGHKANFLAGGEIPIPIVTDERLYVEYKEYGIRLNITPIADANGTIQTRVLTEISEIDNAVAVNGIPGLLTRRVDTEVTVRDGETIVLSGLQYYTAGKDITKVPLLGHIPIIGELFKSRQFRERQTELAVFVTPRLVDPVSAHLRELGEQMRQRYQKAEDEVSFGIFD